LRLPEATRSAFRASPLHTAWRFALFGVGGFGRRRELDAVATYCLFLGHARSGHSIVGALLDAHPQIVISDELDALRYLGAGFTRRQLLYGSIEISRRQAAGQRRKAGRDGRVYSYAVPGQWQGRTRDLRVVGDSQAGWTTRRLAADPSLLPRLERRMAPLDLRFIHVVRNPFDNVATMMLRGGRDFESAFTQYAANCDSIGPLAARIGEERVTRVRHEDLVQRPHPILDGLCRFLGVNATQDYLDAAGGILYASPSRSRSEVEWPPSHVERVEQLIERHPFLAGYALADEPATAAG
jgi:hypothetical protein